MNSKEMFKKIECLENEVLEIKNTFLKSMKKTEPYELFLKTTKNNNLSIVFLDKVGRTLQIGRIENEGKCFILNSDHIRRNYEIWAEQGFKVKDTTTIRWNNGQYVIKRVTGNVYLSRENFKCGIIYNFTSAKPVSDCEDTNINRHSCNNTPILY